MSTRHLTWPQPTPPSQQPSLVLVLVQELVQARRRAAVGARDENRLDQ
ncbi:hypothetical protein AB0G87_05750 [Streptomyces asoensis]